MRFFSFAVVIEKEAEDEGYHAQGNRIWPSSPFETAASRPPQGEEGLGKPHGEEGAQRPSRTMRRHMRLPCYYAWSPTLAGCFSNGRTIEEAKRGMREAVTQHVESLLAHGEPVPHR